MSRPLIAGKTEERMSTSSSSSKCYDYGDYGGEREVYSLGDIITSSTSLVGVNVDAYEASGTRGRQERRVQRRIQTVGTRRGRYDDARRSNAADAMWPRMDAILHGES